MARFEGLQTPPGRHLYDPSRVSRAVAGRRVRCRDEPDLLDLPNVHSVESTEAPARHSVQEYRGRMTHPRASPDGTGPGTKPTRPQLLDGLSGIVCGKLIQLCPRDDVGAGATARRHRLTGSHHQDTEESNEGRAHDCLLRSEVRPLPQRGRWLRKTEPTGCGQADQQQRNVIVLREGQQAPSRPDIPFPSGRCKSPVGPKPPGAHRPRNRST